MLKHGLILQAMISPYIILQEVEKVGDIWKCPSCLFETGSRRGYSLTCFSFKVPYRHSFSFLRHLWDRYLDCHWNNHKYFCKHWMSPWCLRCNLLTVSNNGVMPSTEKGDSTNNFNGNSIFQQVLNLRLAGTYINFVPPAYDTTVSSWALKLSAVHSTAQKRSWE